MADEPSTSQPTASAAQANPSPLISNVPLPPQFDVRGNLVKNWKRWIQVWNAYETVTGLNQRANDYRVAAFITCIGPDALEIHVGLPFDSEDDKKNINKVLELWNKYCIGNTNVIYERYKFNNRSQENGESADTYASAVRALADTCAFGTLKDDLIRDRLVCGIADNGVRKKLLQEPSLTLAKCLDICRAAESTKAQVKEISNHNSLPAASSEINHVRRGKPRNGPRTNSTTQMINDCKFCGRSHEGKKEKCPAYGKSCSKCGKQNHFSAKCQAKVPARSSQKPHKGNYARNKVHMVGTYQDASSEEEILFVTFPSSQADEGYDVNKVDTPFKSKIYATMELADKPVKMQVDTGASCNVLPRKYLPANSNIEKTDRELLMYCKSSMPVLGTARVSMRNPKNGKKYRAEFVVVEGDFTPLIGARAAQQMKLVVVQQHNICQVSEHDMTSAQQSGPLTKERVLREYADVFGGLGKMAGQLHLQVDETVSPTVVPPRRLPIAIKGKVKEELTRLVNAGVLQKVEEPTDWVSSMVVTAKSNGRVRICIDPKQLNQALKRSHYPLPVIEDMLPDLAKVRVFSKADLKDGFLQIELDEESSILTTFQTPWGRYRWRRMPFGICPAPEYFQQKLDENLEGLEGVYKIADDLLITGQGNTPLEADQDHDNNMRRLLERCRQRNIKLNETKLSFKCKEVPFIGHVLTKDGLKPDPNKVRAVTDMERPSDVQAVQRLIGLVKYLSKFLAHLSEICKPLRQLTHKDAEWAWTQEQEEAFLGIKKAVTEAPVLKYFDPTEPTEGQGDASSTGLGFALLQAGQPVTYASRALTPAETRYSQIEKELLAQVFGMEHNHQYVYGRQVLLWTDHKPLVSIHKKPLSSAPKRLQRLLLRLQQYDVEIRYRPGPEMHLADTLSRAYLNTGDRSQTEEETEKICAVQFLPMSEPQLREVQKETASDPTLQALKKVILNGWPDSKNEVPAELQPYFTIRDELAAQDGVIFKGARCVVPASLREKIRERLHGAHTGLQGCLRRAREVVYWPRMNADLTDYVSKCEICSTYQPAQAKEPLICHEPPDRPWEKVACDIFTLENKDYLCTVDYYSSYFEVDRLDHKTVAEVTKKLRRHFSSHGIPDKVVSDNAPFKSREFAEFARAYEFEHVTSSPTYAQSNGKVENTIKTAKSLMKKAKESGKDFYLSLLRWRNTPSEGFGSSPAQRMFGRRTKTLLPTAHSLLKPRIIEGVSQKLWERKETQTKYYDRHAKELPPLKHGNIVRVAPKPGDRQHKWFKAQVEEQVDVRSYNVRTEDGRVFRRNRRHLRNSREPFYPAPAIEPSRVAITPSIPTTQVEDKLDKQPTSITTPAAKEPPAKDPGESSSATPPQPELTSQPEGTARSTTVSRRGREIRPPRYLEDYVLSK